MKDQDQIIALAKWDGWMLVEKAPGQFVAWASPDDHWSQQPPDYLNDLNAVHRVTMKLDDQQLCRMAEWLCTITGFHTRIFHATARQRCEALLRTLGLWKEDA